MVFPITSCVLKQYGASGPVQLNSSVAVPNFTCHVEIVNVCLVTVKKISVRNDFECYF